MGNTSNRPGNLELLNATQALDVNKVASVLETGRGISDRALRRALFSTVEANHIELMEALLKAGVEPSCHRQKDSFTPLHIAASNHLPQAARSLLNYGADPSKSDLSGRTSIWMAARLGAPQLLEILLQSPKSSAAVNKPDKSGWTPLMVAASRSRGDVRVVNLLLNANAKVNHIDKEGKCATHVAAAAGDHQVLQALIKHCPSSSKARDSRQNTPLHYAAERGENSCCVVLLKHDPTGVNAKNSKLRTPLWLACERGDPTTATYLLRNNADGDLKDKHGWNALRAAVYSCSMDTVEALLCSGVCVSSVCSAGISALHSAAFYDSKGNIAKLLIDYNASPTLKDKKGKIPLHIAAEVGNENVLRLLLPLGGTTAMLKRSVNKCRDPECLSLLQAALKETPSDPSNRRHVGFQNRLKSKPNVYGSTGSTGESSTSENCSEDASQRLRGTTTHSTHSTSTFTSRFSSMASSFSSVRKKKARPSPSGRSLLPSKIARNTIASSFQCASVSPKNMVVELFDDAAQIEFSEGSLRCSTILYAKLVKSDDATVQGLFWNDNVSFPASAQLWAKPINIEIPGSPGELLLPARINLRCPIPLPGTDLRVFRYTTGLNWEEAEIISTDFIQNNQIIDLSVQTSKLGMFVIACCAGRSVQTVRAGHVERIGVGELKFWAGDDFNGVGLEITTPGVEQGDVVCEIEPPIEYDENDDEPHQNTNIYHASPNHVNSHVDCHPIVISLRLLDQDRVDFKVHLPSHYCLGLKEENKDGLFRRSVSNTFTLTATSRLTICVWKVQDREETIFTNRFHSYKVKAYFSILGVGKNNVIQVSLNESDGGRELICAEMEDIEITAGGSFQLEPIKFKLNRGLLPMNLPIKLVKRAVNPSTEASHDRIASDQRGHIQIRREGRAVLLPINETL